MTSRLIVIAFAASALFAQGPGPRMHGMAGHAKTTEVQSYLNLTDAQIASLQQLRQSEMAELKPIFQQIGPLHQSLRTLQESSSPDATAVGKLVLSIQALEQQAAPIRSSFQQQAVAVLTADQRTKLTALESAAALMPTIHEATALNLLTPPKGSEGLNGFGPAGMPHGRFGGSR
jgi:Spy/CpxP family protein refolding chaperone